MFSLWSGWYSTALSPEADSRFHCLTHWFNYSVCSEEKKKKKKIQPPKPPPYPQKPLNSIFQAMQYLDSFWKKKKKTCCRERCVGSRLSVWGRREGPVPISSSVPVICLVSFFQGWSQAFWEGVQVSQLGSASVAQAEWPEDTPLSWLRWVPPQLGWCMENPSEPTPRSESQHACCKTLWRLHEGGCAAFHRVLAIASF